jgi:hypothetical protein
VLLVRRIGLLSPAAASTRISPFALVTVNAVAGVAATRRASTTDSETASFIARFNRLAR